jgi:2-C-methyl-D-erythritol 4-phosphate cytidylyltransferase
MTESTSQTLGVVVPAAGTGRRMGGLRKQYLELAGEPVLVWALRPFLAHPALSSVVVALPPGDEASPPEWLTAEDPRISFVAGGESRGESVFNALGALPPVDVIMVHDGARPLVSEETVDRCFRAAAGGDGVVAGVPAVDTLKGVDSDSRILETLDRSRIWQAHTPQSFPAPVLLEAYEAAREAGFPATDDSALVEASGGSVRMVHGNADNLKVTRPEDLVAAEAILRSRRDHAQG